MSLFHVQTETPYDLYQKWKGEVGARLVDIPGRCIVFSDFKSSALVYAPDIDGDLSVFLNNAPSILRSMSTPVYSVPEVDMSDTSFGDFFGVYDMPYSGVPLEDVTVADVVSLLKHVSLYNSVEPDIRRLCLFAKMAQCEQDASVLKSYINQIMVDRGHDNIIFGEFGCSRHSKLELRSEMLRCNSDLYNVYKVQLVESMLLNIVECSRSKAEVEYGISSMAYEILCDNVVNCVGVLWCFINGLWQECSFDGYIWNFLTTDLIKYLESKEAGDIALHMMSVHVRAKILKDIKMRIQDDAFYTLLDAKRNIIRMENGVYDTDTMQLSYPVPSDYTSVTAGVPYQIFDMESRQMLRLLDILGSIFPNRDILDFFILSCATYLEGYNSPKVFFIWWGSGNNAKSLVQTLVMKTFGEYCSSAPTSLVTGKRGSSSNATPELCHVEKRLVVFLQEPNPDEKIKAGQMKEMTGNDVMYVRQLFKSGKTMTLKAKFVIVCNNIIEIPGMDAAIRRRMVVIPFTSTFLDANEYKSRQMKGTLEEGTQMIDPAVEHELLSCKSAFMYLLCRKYHELKHESNMALHIPQIIREITEEYATRNNYPLRFIRLFVRYLPGSYVATTEIYECYKEWFKRSYPGQRTQDFEKFTQEMAGEGYQDDGRGVTENVFVSYTGELAN